MRPFDRARQSLSGPAVLLVVASTAIGFGARAQSQDSTPEPPLLSGPDIRAGGDGVNAGSDGMSMEESVRSSPTLIQRSFDGSLIELEVNPAEAALGFLELTDEEQAATRRVLEARAAMASAIAREHVDLFLRVQASRQGGDQEAVRKLMREAIPVLAPLLRPTLAESLASELSESNAAILQRMVEEYKQAVMESREPGSDPATQGRASNARASLRYESGLVLREIARSIAATVESRRDQAEALYEAVDATPEQREQIQSILRQMGAAETLGTHSPERRREIMERIFQILTPEQRVRARAYLRGG